MLFSAKLKLFFSSCLSVELSTYPKKMTDYVRFQERSRLEGTCQQRLEGPNLFLLGESDENLRRHCDVVKNAAIKARMKHPQNITKVQFYFLLDAINKSQLTLETVEYLSTQPLPHLVLEKHLNIEETTRSPLPRSFSVNFWQELQKAQNKPTDYINTTESTKTFNRALISVKAEVLRADFRESETIGHQPVDIRGTDSYACFQKENGGFPGIWSNFHNFSSFFLFQKRQQQDHQETNGERGGRDMWHQRSFRCQRCSSIQTKVG